MNTITAPHPPPTILSPPSASNRNGRRTLAIIAALAVLGLALSVFMVASLALFTDTENVGANVFATGDVNIAASPATAVFTPGPMAPGDQVTAEIVVLNGGSLDLRYMLTSTTTEDVLAGELVLTVKDGVAACDNANWTTGGVQLYTGVLGATLPAAGVTLFGDAFPGADTGDRALAPTVSEKLCFNVSLPIAATNASQNLTTTATFNFVAEQTKNNA